MHTHHPAFENYLFIVFCSFNANSVFVLCLKPYPEDPAVYKPLSQEELQRIKNEKKQKQNERKQKISENRKHLASVRVVQKNLVFVVGLSQRLADPEVSCLLFSSSTWHFFFLFIWK